MCGQGHYFASASADRTARVWSTERAQPLRTLVGHHSDVSLARWHPNCHYVATGSHDRTVRLWDVRDGRSQRILVGHRAAVRSRNRSCACVSCMHCTYVTRQPFLLTLALYLDVCISYSQISCAFLLLHYCL